MRNATVTCLLVVIVAAQSVAGGVVELRGGQESLEAPIIAVDEGGVVVRNRDGSSRTLAWDLIRNIEPDSPDPTLDRKLALAQDLWRARSRLQRNDPVLAEPLFERLFERYRGTTSETALIVAQGLLRCRLARGDHASAVLAFLETLRLHRAGIRTDRYDLLKPVFDPAIELCPQLAPIWIDDPARETLRRGLTGYDAQGDDVVHVCAELFRMSARGVSESDHLVDELKALNRPNHDGLELLAAMLEAQMGDADRRASARERLLHRLNAGPEWTEAWIRMSVGVSYLQESDPEAHRKGMVSLAHLPARYAQSHPFLAGLALARLAESLTELGHIDEAQSLRAELRRRYPGHPILFVEDRETEPKERTKEHA